MNKMKTLTVISILFVLTNGLVAQESEIEIIDKGTTVTYGERLEFPDDNLPLLDSLLQQDSTDAFIHFRRGNVNTKQGNYQDAIQDFTTAISHKPNSYMSYGNRGMCKANLGDTDAAIEDFTHSLEIKPDNAQQHFNRGYSYLLKLDYSKALEDFNKVASINPSFPYVYYRRGICLYSLQKDNEALEDFNKTIEYDPDNSDAYFWRGVVLLQLGQDSSCNDIEKAKSMGHSRAKTLYESNCKK